MAHRYDLFPGPVDANDRPIGKCACGRWEDASSELPVGVCPNAQHASPKTSPSTSPPTKKQRKEMLLMEELINAVFVDNKRIITTEEDSKIWSLPEDGNVYWDGSSTKRLVIQPQWLQLYAQIIDGAQTHVLLEGKAGRGKSVFLRYMILRMLEDPAIPNEATFAYVVKDSMGDSRTFWIAKNGFGVNVVVHIPERPDYLLLDNVDSALNMRGEKLNLGLTSGDREVLKEFRKRVAEAGELGKYHAMQAPDLEVMRLMFSALSSDDLQFRFDVLGGNPRRFRDVEPASVLEEIEQLVYPELQSCISMFFGATYDHNKIETAEGLRARWAMRVIAKEVQQSADCDSSLFRAEFATDDGYCQTRFASSFLRLVAGALDSKNDASLRDALKRIVESSGLGYAHEYLSHAAFLAGDPATITFGLNTARAIVQLPAGLYGRAVTLVRNIPDLKNLPGTTYGLPTISNFPAVDAIVSLILLQMTISDKHGGAVDKLPDIATSLGVAVADLILIFVVESVEKAWAFKFPVLPGIRMLVTPRDVCTEQALQTGH
ncbi:hypothetical protein B484DRAFT_424314 [Ochromonadaceae sp. CCMP2298]|nr:hypothetical protein B484DRAFT_424314 [Ochromonadaceae sp. CCMP2298]|mmetsp:Transcript_4720/g.10623  ORF Transcript_4720/g.10623 Transcript_4720/m.10623 type:complete len:546 (-) Transcript_4720:73-1710(-)